MPASLLLRPGIRLLQLTRLYPPELPGINIDSEWIYRRFLPHAARYLLDQAHVLGVRLEIGLRHILDVSIQRIFHLHGPQSVLARTWQTGQHCSDGGGALRGGVGIFLLLGAANPTWRSE